VATFASSLRGALRFMEGAAFLAGEGQLRSHTFVGISVRVGSLGPPAAGAVPARRPLGCWWPCWPSWGPSSLQRTDRWFSAPSSSTGGLRSRLRCATTTPCTWARIVASSRRTGFGRSSLGGRPRGPARRPSTCPSLRQPPAGWWTAAGSHGGGRPSSKPPRGGGATCSPGCMGDTATGTFARRFASPSEAAMLRRSVLLELRVPQQSSRRGWRESDSHLPPPRAGDGRLLDGSLRGPRSQMGSPPW
jgi:hypothetical protein